MLSHFKGLLFFAFLINADIERMGRIKRIKLYTGNLPFGDPGYLDITIQNRPGDSCNIKDLNDFPPHSVKELTGYSKLGTCNNFLVMSQRRNGVRTKASPFCRIDPCWIPHDP